MTLDGEAFERITQLLERGDVPAAQAALAQAVEDCRAREELRRRSLAEARHDLGNALAIAQASIEAMLDGVVEISDRRLNRVREILSEVSASMYRLTSERNDGSANGA